MRIFISHSWDDKPTVRELVKLPNFIDVWMDERDLSAGADLDPSLKTAIEDSHVFLCMVSTGAINKEWVQKELEWALQCELERNATVDRIFVIPVILEKGIRLGEYDTPFSQLEDRLHIDATERTPNALASSRKRIADALFQWCCERLDDYEPEGSGTRFFSQQLEHDLIEFQNRLYALKAALCCPIQSLVKSDAIKHLDDVTEKYNQYGLEYVKKLTDQENEVRWRIKGASRTYLKLAEYIREDVFRGAAFALNDIVTSLNSYRSDLATNPEKYDLAEQNRLQRINELEEVMEELTDKAENFLDALRG